MFYDRFRELCLKLNKTPSGVGADLGISKSTISSWKSRGNTPSGDVLQRIADYFGVSTDYLLNGTEAEKTDEEDLAEMLQRIKDDPELRTLFSLAKDATPDDVRKAIASTTF